MKTRVRVPLSYILAGTLFCSSSGVAMATGEPPVFQINPQKTVLAGLPFGQEFAEEPWTAPKWGPFDEHDPALDDDPYFLHSQHWYSGEPASSEVGTRVHVDGTGIDIQLADSSVAVRIDQPLSPVVESDEYLFLRARSEDFFKRKTTDEDGYGEGLFFIDKRDLRQESKSTAFRHGVPVFFFALPDSGWTSEIEAVEIPDAAPSIAFRTADGNTVSLELEDVDLLSRALHQTLLFAVMNELRFMKAEVTKTLVRAIQSPDGRIELPYVLPPRGSTAVFGSFLTGMNLDHPERSLGVVASSERSLGHHSLISWILPEAEASTGIISPDLAARLWVIGGVSLGLVVTSIYTKYFLLRDKMTEIRSFLTQQDIKRAREKGKRPPNINGRFYKAFAEFRDNVSIFTHSLAATFFAPAVLQGYLAEYGADRLLGATGRSPNGLVRKFIEKTLIYDRSRTEKVAMNNKSFWYGTGVLGGVDCAGVVYQMVWFSPWFMPWAANMVSGPDLARKVQVQFSGADAATSNVVTSEIIRNITAYAMNGGFSYSADNRSYYKVVVTPEVENQLRRQGKNLTDDNVKHEVNERVEKQIESLMVERGLPTSKEHLFSAPALFRGLMGKLGYKVDRDAVAEETGPDTRFILENGRWGILNYVLKRSIQEAKGLYSIKPDPNIGIAINMLVETKQNYNTGYNILKLGAAAFSGNDVQPALDQIKNARRVRQMLTTLSYAGDDIFSPNVKFLNIWKGADTNPEAARIAARIYRQALFSILDGNDYYLKPDREQIAKYWPEAMQEAEMITSDNHDPQVGFTDADKKLMALEIVKGKIAQEIHRDTVENWKPPEESFDLGMTERQRNRAHAKAMQMVGERVVDQVVTEESILTQPEIFKIYREAYRVAISEEVGLYAFKPESSALVRKVQKDAEDEVEASLNSAALSHYYSQLSDTDKLRFVTHLYAEAFLNHYVSLTVSKSKDVSLLSPEQPGFFQRARQSRLAMGTGIVGKTVTVLLRAAESPWANNAYGFGFTNWRHRTIPLYRDVASAIQNRGRTMVGAASATWAAQYYIWQVKFPWKVYVFFLLCSTLLGAAQTWLDRLLMNVNLPPLNKVWYKIVYGLGWTWLSYFDYLPFFFYKDDWNYYFDEFVTDPALQSWAFVSTLPDKMVSICQKLLSVSD